MSLGCSAQQMQSLKQQEIAEKEGRVQREGPEGDPYWDLKASDMTSFWCPEVLTGGTLNGGS